MDRFIFVSHSEGDTRRLGDCLGGSIVAGTVIGLNGTLGMGKTRLTQALGRALGIPDGEIVSPTFTICVPHEGTLGLLHLDAYRIKDPTEVDELGLDELTENGVVLIVEWAQRIEKYLPPIDLTVSIESIGDQGRTFEFVANSGAGSELISKTVERWGENP